MKVGRLVGGPQDGAIWQADEFPPFRTVPEDGDPDVRAVYQQVGRDASGVVYRFTGYVTDVDQP